MKLEQWSVCHHPDDSPWLAPEQKGISLQGEVFGDSRGRSDGCRIVTTNIKSIVGRRVTTESGSIYDLGSPSDDYIRFCVAEGHHVPTHEEPIRIVDAGVAEYKGSIVNIDGVNS